MEVFDAKLAIASEHLSPVGREGREIGPQLFAGDAVEGIDPGGESLDVLNFDGIRSEGFRGSHVNFEARQSLDSGQAIILDLDAKEKGVPSAWMAFGWFPLNFHAAEVEPHGILAFEMPA
jgi:hypothetical protein